jgi:uncharacterized protein YbjT (DUF2867 family)
MRISLAGASGVLGVQLVPLLVADGHEVAGMTRSPDKAQALRELGAEPVVRLLRAAALWVVAALLLVLPGLAWARRPIPDTTGAVHVWDDQLPDSMIDAQIRFVATHVDGTQKVSLQTARRLRAVNPGFLVLHYRLGIG